MIPYSDLFKLAQQLVSSVEADEASLRCAVSRAYYATYHAARSLNLKSNQPGTVHDALIRSFTESTDARLVTIGNQLKTLKSERVKADYRLQEPFSRSDAKKHVIGASRILDAIETLQSPK